MPELPEVETIKNDLSEAILNKQIVGFKVIKKNILRKTPSYFQGKLISNKFVEINRRGKLIYFSLAKENLFLLVHLKMTGQFIYCNKDKFIAGGHANSKKEEEQISKGDLSGLCQKGKYTRLIFEFSDKSKLFFNDLRLFAYLDLVNQKELGRVLDRFGIEPLTSGFKFKDFFNILQNRRTTIKAVLLNQQLIAGIGNIYADESLFASGIMPDRAANKIIRVEARKLFLEIEKILKKSIKYRGTTFSDYVDSRGEKGNFVKLLKVYGRQGKKCLKCKTTIQKTKVAGRGTHFCPKCQKF